ncbi:MAG: hypothetical protein HY847_14910 [Betaproteobacteria bacterium]|nr:hypothetical protein [Betaproteobacteria bacterium]
MKLVEIAISFINYPALKRWEAKGSIGNELLQKILNPENPLCRLLPEARLSGVYLGSEFCEFLLPTPEILKRGIKLAELTGAGFALATPLASDGVIDQLKELLPLLPGESELIVNDWGVASMARRQVPALKLVAGRLLCKMIKDPRLNSSVWTEMYPHGLSGDSFGRMLDMLGIARIELDVPPYATPQVFADLQLPTAVHAPFGYVSKGRLCKIGSLSLPVTQKFSSGRECRRECLTYVAETKRSGNVGDLETHQRGNTLFYRHTQSMAEAVVAAFERGWLQRLVLPGD